MSNAVNNAEETCLNKNHSENVITIKDAPDPVANAQGAAVISPTVTAHSGGLTSIAEKTQDVVDIGEKHDFPEGGLRAWLVQRIVFLFWLPRGEIVNK